MIRAADLLSVGIYSPSEAALYARVRPQLMSRWMYGAQGERRNDPVVDPQLGLDEGKTVTFLDFIQALAIRRLRNERNIPLQRIRVAYNRARDEYQLQYPFATEGARIGLFGPPDRPDRQVIFVCFDDPSKEAEKRYYQLTGHKHGNQLIGEVVMTYARFLEFNPNTKLACKYTSYKSDDGQVTMDPEVRFGEPFVESTGYTARALFNAYKTEGSIDRAATIYGVDGKDIQLAIDYFDFLNLPAAA